MNTLNYYFIVIIFLLAGIAVKFKRSEIKRFNEQKEFLTSIAILKHQIMDLKQDKWRKDELIMDIESSFSDNNYKEAIRFKKIYFYKPL